MTSFRTILALDPGTVESGWVLWDLAEMRVIRSGVDDNDFVEDRLCFQFGGAEWDACVIERPAPMGQVLGRDLLETIWTAARFTCAAEAIAAFGDVTIQHIERMEVKRQLLGRTTGNDTQVNAAVRAYVANHHHITEKEVKGTKKAPGPCFGIKSHAWAALAVCLTAHLNGSLSQGEAA